MQREIRFINNISLRREKLTAKNMGGKKVKEAVEGLKEQGFPVYVGQWMPCPVCKAPWKFHKADKKIEGKPPVIMCPTFESVKDLSTPIKE